MELCGVLLFSYDIAVVSGMVLCVFAVRSLYWECCAV